MPGTVPAANNRSTKVPRELRKIIFTAEELVHAVKSYDRVTDAFLPPGEVRAVRVEQQGGVRLVVSLQLDTVGARDVDVSLEEVIELLIRACLENNIPIPRRADKFLAVLDGDLAMVMDIVDEDASGVPTQRVNTLGWRRAV